MGSESPPDDVRPVALVTGGCSGIGKAIAQQLALRGYSLVLVSERAERLETVAREIRAAHAVPVHLVCLNLARAEAAQELFVRLRSLKLQVDVFINNAGMFFFGEVADATPEAASALLQLQVVTPSLLCTLFGREMRGRRRGHILIVSSISAWRDFPGIAYYGSSKKYLRGFARALRSEMGVHGVGVTCLAPGPTVTGLYDTTPQTVRRGRRMGLFLEPERVAEAGLQALFAGRAECVPGLSNRVLGWAAALTPQWLVDRIRRRASWLSAPEP